MVYAIVEVKGALRWGDLKEIANDIKVVRSMAQYRVYMEYDSEPLNENNPTEKVVKQRELPVSKPAPRSFVFAYSQKSWNSIKGLERSLKKVLDETDSHIHGLIVLKDGWYVVQKDYTTDTPAGTQFDTYEDTDSLLRFVRDMIHAIASMKMSQASIDRYLKPKIGPAPKLSDES